MLHSLFSLSLQSTLHKKRTTVLVFAALMLTFSFAVVTLSLVESISKTNEAYRYSAFGEWYLAIPSGKEGDGEWLAQQPWAGKIGMACSYGRATRSFDFGTVDEAYISMAGIRLRSGSLPENPGEVAVEARVLEKLGYDESVIGQRLTFALGAELPVPEDPTIVQKWINNGWIKDAGATSLSVGYDGGQHTQTYTLCGVLEDYSDLWSIPNNKRGNRPPCVLMTEETAQESLAALNEFLQKNYPDLTLIEPNQQYYIYVAQENRALAAKAAEEYMKSTRDYLKEDISPNVNNAAYPPELETATAPDRVYPVLIAVVALVAVLCTYLMNLQAEVHSFAVLRSIGITKGQLLVLMGMESLLLAVPATLLGIPLGAGLIRLALRLLLYAGSISVQASIPRDALALLLALWLCVIVLARLVVFFITVCTPLTGGVQLQQGKVRISRRFRRALIALLLTGFVSAVLYVAAESYLPAMQKQTAEAEPDYVFTSGYQYTVGSNTATYAPISYSAAERLAALPGVSFAEGYWCLLSNEGGTTALGFSLDGTEEQPTDFFVLDETHWANALNLSEEETQAFHAGELVLLAAPANMPQPEEIPQEITLYAREDGVCVGEAQTAVQLWQQPAQLRGRLIPISTAHTVICSQAYLEKLVAALEPGRHWGCFTGGEEVGYATLWLTCSELAGELSIQYTIEEICRQEGLTAPENNCREKQATIQACAQELLLLYACSGCIALVSLLLLASALALEAEQERKSYTILRVIGMSRRQMQRRIFARTLAQSMLALLCGWTLVTALDVQKRLEAYRQYGWTLERALKLVPADHLALYGSQSAMLVLIAVMLAVILCVSLLSKRSLRHTALLR